MSVSRSHNMPFGATVQPEGVEFRLWAPAANRVDVCIVSNFPEEQTDDLLAMSTDPDGWFALTVPGIGHGTEYFYRIDGESKVPDPASRYQPHGVYGPSAVIDPGLTPWHDSPWRNRDWEEIVIYELHVGSFTEQGTFSALKEKLPYLAELGVTAIQVMPIAEFPGRRNWGYDGVLPFSPAHQYGTPEDFKALVQAAHEHSLMVILDVVYNHFGPEGNYLNLYAPGFFTKSHQTPWGAAINFDGAESHWVRQFFINNALYWLHEYNLDGLRFDAVHAIIDASRPDILIEISQCVREIIDRPVHLILENENNSSCYLTRTADQETCYFDAQFNDDIHHALHVLLTDETEGYYQDFAQAPLEHLTRCLSDGFCFQGELSSATSKPRGSPSEHLPPTAFVGFLQNHDQIGNRAFGDRITTLTEDEALRAATVLLLLSPSPPLLFMGQEWGCEQPFTYFCDFGPELAEAVSSGRRKEFAHFSEFGSSDALQRIPDPCREETFRMSRLDWSAGDPPKKTQWMQLHRELLELRQQAIVPLIKGIIGRQPNSTLTHGHLVTMHWHCAASSGLFLIANLGERQSLSGNIASPEGRLLFGTHDDPFASGRHPDFPSWSVFWYLDTKEAPA
ncbi:MAG: malto-oligosyltrehalose trehalohydrolase [Pseudohongiellaceae bacterium]